ncbi:MAG: M24 family metallopeptidase, partial [Chloroflexota bacterium]|nr:M24 family metallopeptidase [Chloroflexota bacterium]
ADVRNLKSLNPGLKELLDERGIGGQVGLVAFDEALNATRYDDIVAGLKGFDCRPADELMAAVRRSLRSREISAIKHAAGLARAAAEALATAHSAGASNGAAVVEADGEARRLGALDVRCLANLDGTNQLVPLEELTSFRTDSMVAYVAVNSLGYWADLGVTLGSPGLLEEAERALQAMLAGVKAGAEASDVARLAEQQLSEQHLHEAQLYGLGNGLALSLDAAPHISPFSHDSLVENTVLSLRVRIGSETGPGALASALVLVKPDGCEKLG